MTLGSQDHSANVGLRSSGRTRRPGRGGSDLPLPIPRRGPNSPPGVTAPLRGCLSPPPRRPRPRPLFPVPPSLYLVPPSLPPPNTYFSRLPPGVTKFLRSRPRALPGPGGSSAPAALSSRTNPGQGPGPFEPCCVADGGTSAAGATRPRCRPRSQRPLGSRPRPHPRTAAPRGRGCRR